MRPELSDYNHISAGKVREIYEVDDNTLLMVVSDRISAYDHILDPEIPDKGRVLTAMSVFFFNAIDFPNHLAGPIDDSRIPEEVLGRALIVKKLKMLPFECVARGYLTGSGLKEYQADGTVCGIELPEGLVEASKLPEPIFTPATKAELGDHDENVSFDAVVEKLGEKRAEELRDAVGVEIFATELAGGGRVEGDRRSYQQDPRNAREPLEEIRTRCEDRAVQLLALEGPVARDLRQVVSSIYIVEDFDRMAALAIHIAKAARRRHPEHAIPVQLLGYFKEMARLVEEMGEKTRDILVDPNADVALVLNEDDDAIDDLNEYMLTMLTMREWEHTTREAVDVALLSRYYERYADHCVNVAARIVYLATGYKQEDYMRELDTEERRASITKRLSDLERHFNM